MHHIIGICRGLIYIYQFSLIFSFSLIMGCFSGSSSDHPDKSETLLVSGPETLLDPQVLLEKSNTTKEAYNPVDQVKSLKSVAKVEEGKQAILLLHGLHRLSYDFDAMQAAIKKALPHVAIFPLRSIDKNSNKKGAVYISPSMGLSLIKQAELCCKEIIEKVPSGSHVVMVAHSQGGLRAYALIKEYFERLKNEHGITIEALITIATPWKGAPVYNRIKKAHQVMKKFKRITNTLEIIHKDYSKHLLRIFFRLVPGLAESFPSLYGKCLTAWGCGLPKKIIPGAADLDPESNFICNYVASGLKEIDLPITAIAGVLTDFSKLFEPFPSSIGPQALAELNATYADLIGGNRACEHDMLLPVGTQHAEGLVKKNFKCIKVYGACHGNKVGISVKRGLSELNNEAVIEKVIESIEEAFYEKKEEPLVEKGEEYPPAA